MTLVDTNVLLDVVSGDRRWGSWSLQQLKDAAVAGPLAINAVIYAELSVRFESMKQLDASLLGMSLRMEPIERAALFSAAKAFQTYRTRGGTRTDVLPDFFIGACAGGGLAIIDARSWSLSDLLSSRAPGCSGLIPLDHPINAAAYNGNFPK